MYTCPTCGEKLERDLLLFTQHTDEHIVEQIKKSNPKWVTPDGFCVPCLDYYKKALKHEKAGKPVPFYNLGSSESRKRVVLGTVCLGLAFAAMYRAYSHEAPSAVSFAPVFVFMFGAMLGFVQAKQNTCVVLGLKGAKNLDVGERKVQNSAEALALRRTSFNLIILSSVVAAAVTAALFAVVRVHH